MVDHGCELLLTDALLIRWHQWGTGLAVGVEIRAHWVGEVAREVASLRSFHVPSDAWNTAVDVDLRPRMVGCCETLVTVFFQGIEKRLNAT